ncbi:N-6 DNA methylase [Phototrophicus methaneseepsis]|uniref:site-specific DNA-methyltransferase (adenine-specific) n=1 Tax=Phototrophicus methaneseepsis TaxID=2710758 RepID=A0A7S8EB84_9CHLR|nr:N-6 DNA methylase [Phototrophicus methaneseepsis]QPC83765.1 N-6 DNA methylase [Phototrophicus methaneseepsis]
MNKQQASVLINETFENAFDEDQYLRFLRELFNGQIDESDDRKFDYYGQYIPDSFKDYVRRYKRLGTYTDSDGHEIDLLIVILKRERSLDQARTMQRNFAAYHLKRRDKETAIIAYTTEERSDWRFSMVRREPVVAFSEKGNLIAKDELTPVRRYSFLVGQSERSHTAQQQLFPILLDDKHDPTLDGLEEAFNIETVTKEFFERYKALFLQLKEELDRLTTKDSRVQAEFKAKELDTANFAKKLLGQIVFLYFLQKKGWLGVREGDTWGTGPKDFLRQLFDRKWVSYDNFFDDVLEPLFYEALAIERDDNIYPRLKARIPFLNGGLFEPMNNYNWKNTAILIDNKLFEDIFDTFDLYNFTVREDEPLEKEVAVDPEMLGKVFENLLEVIDRKSKGAFYTPREIVHYMCQESLINYLATAMGDAVPREELATFIRVGELAVQNDTAKEAGTVTYTYQMPESIRTHATKLDAALANIKICDPAIGSGAFPVGMMQEIIKAREVLTIYIGKSNSRTTYNFKRQAIQESIYGVDIDSSAIDIAKLRLWLSLVVDEDDYHHIKPLPNLDYKIVCGNSLLSVQKDLFNLDLFQKLEKLKTAYFDQTDPAKKQAQRAEIDSLIARLTGGHSTFDMQIYFSEVFHGNSGFDVVIGNPPYVKEYTNRQAFDGLRDSKYYQGKMDLWYFFGCIGIDILRSTGTQCFIAPNNWTTNAGASILRNKIVGDSQIINFIDFGDFRVFSAGIQTMVFLLEKNSDMPTYKLQYSKLLNSNADLTLLKRFLYSHEEDDDYIKYHAKFVRSDLKDSFVTFLPESLTEIVDRVESHPYTLLKPDELTQGIVPNPDVVTSRGIKKIPQTKVKKLSLDVGDGVFVISRGSLDSLSEHEKKFLRPLYHPSDLQRFFLPEIFYDEIIYLTKDNASGQKAKIPNLLAHLEKYRDIMDDRRENQNGRLDFYHLHWPRDERFFEEGPKILSVRKCAIPTFVYTEKPTYVMMAFNVVKTKRFNLKFLTALLNSKVVTFWLLHKGKMQGYNFQVDKEPLLGIPLKTATKAIENDVEKKVDRLITLLANNKGKPTQDTKHIEDELDKIFYDLYELSKSDRQMIEQTIAQHMALT